MTNNILLSLNKNQEKLNALEIQLSTGKKIQKPSEDPIVAVRSLKFRSSIKEVAQYQRNVNDAKSWLQVSDQALVNTGDIMQRIRELCVQGSNDSLQIEDRKMIATEIDQLRVQLFREGNVSYAGRFVFSGYKTDEPLIISEPNTTQYQITQDFKATDIKSTKMVFDGPPPEINTFSKIDLAYQGTVPSTPPGTIAGFVVNPTNSTVAGVYQPPIGTCNLIQDTGELVFNQADVASIPANFSFSYDKAGLSSNELNPIHYFDTIKKVDPLDNTTWVNYSKVTEDLNFKVSYNQEMKINTNGDEVFTPELFKSLNLFIRNIKNADQSDKTLKGQLTNDLLGQFFNDKLGEMDEHINNCLDRQSDVGSRINRLELSYNRMQEDTLNFTELLSDNEDVDIAEVMVNMKSQEMVYNASLMSSGKIVQQSLLNFLG